MKRRALGKGLSSLIPTPATSTEPLGNHMSAADIESIAAAETATAIPLASAERVESLDISRISANPHQPRLGIPEEKLEELAASIRAAGVIQPILVRPHGNGYQLVAGERRLRAAKKAGYETVPAVVRSVADDELLEMALIENLQREDLNPIEEARAYTALQRARGLSQTDIADRVGKDRSTVANVLRLLKLPQSLQRRLASGVLAMGHARALLGLVDPAEQERIAQIAENRGLSVRQTEALVRRANRPTAPADEAVRRDPNVVAAEESLCRSLGTKVRILQSRAGRGRVVIEFYSDEELERIYEAIVRT